MDYVALARHLELGEDGESVGELLARPIQVLLFLGERSGLPVGIWQAALILQAETDGFFLPVKVHCLFELVRILPWSRPPTVLRLGV